VRDPNSGQRSFNRCASLSPPNWMKLTITTKTTLSVVFITSQAHRFYPVPVAR